MVLINKSIIKSCDESKQQFTVYLKTGVENIQFDSPLLIYGINLRPPCFYSPQRALKFIVTNTDNVDRIFVTSSESMGILFIDTDIDIYISQPVYDQILANYYSLLNLRLTYEDKETSCKDANVKIVDIGKANLEQLKKNVRFVTYNEVVELNKLSVVCKPSGIFIGGCSFLCNFDSKKLHISNKITNRRKFAIEHEQIEADYEININNAPNITDSIENFNKKMLNVKSKTLIVACDIPTTGVDIMFHLLYIFKKKSRPTLCVKYHKFLEYISNLSNHSDWVSQPMNIQSIIDNFDIIEDIKDLKHPSILLIDKNHLYGINLQNCDIITIGDEIKRPIKTHNDGQWTDNTGHEPYFDSVFLDSYILSDANYKMCHNTWYSVNVDCNNTTILLNDSLKDINENKIFLYGQINNTDKYSHTNINIEINTIDIDIVNYLLQKEQYFYHEQQYFFPKFRIKILQTEDGDYKIIKC
ncbi:hypothetical protein NGRA_2041 [Nosema granulosis]|uniref:Uncharacterized protein n=1 Tax=Nosema granulosis TaxID=83296 RepID=A0A9P6H038_9MICR|nr:hypothetical protein NGRA_2041 [Nosema granulosis]